VKSLTGHNTHKYQFERCYRSNRKHQNNNPGSDDIKEIHEKLDNLSKAIREKDQIIDDLVEKIKLIEENFARKEELTEESCENGNDFLPYNNL
jgi:uncharacterized membrane protein